MKYILRSLVCIWNVLTDDEIYPPQFGQYMKLINEMVRRVETEHRTKLEQLSKMQEQTK